MALPSVLQVYRLVIVSPYILVRAGLSYQDEVDRHSSGLPFPPVVNTLQSFSGQ